MFLFAQFHHCLTAPELIELALPSFDRPPPGKSLVTGAQLIFFNKDFFLMWTIYKVLIEFVTIAFRFYGCFIHPKAKGILALQRGIKLAPPALEGKVSTTGSPWESLGKFTF